MYSPRDMLEARRSLNRCRGLLALTLTPLLAVYGLGIWKGWQGVMLAALLAGFACALFICDLKLMPALRYVRFLGEMERGLRRSVVCVLERLDGEEQMQDGVCVRALHVRLAESSDSRIFYVNAAKLDMLPALNTKVCLGSYGRHVVQCEEL